MSGNPKNLKTQLSLSPYASFQQLMVTWNTYAHLGMTCCEPQMPWVQPGGFNQISRRNDSVARNDSTMNCRWTADWPMQRSLSKSTYFTRYLMLQLVSWSGALRDSSHIIHTIRNTRNIRNTTLWFGTCQTGAPNEILSMGPRVRRDATEHYQYA